MINRFYCIIAASLAILVSGCKPSPVVKDSRTQLPVRGVWLTNVASDALNSREKIQETVSLCSELGFNSIFVVTWNRGYTLYPSKVLERITGERIHPDFKGRDPLQELIEEAKKKNIRIHAWFEFGFSSSYQDSTGGPILQKNRHWASLDKDGKITEKNGFQWMNPFHPEVQQFISDMILEVVNGYDVDGIQGDDRLPALPSNGGYDPYTVALYRQENEGRLPPSNEKDYDWIKWRSAKLSGFLKDLSAKIRLAKPGITISMAPSIYPWSEEHYLQDWPSWLAMNSVDVIIPQVYRYQLDRYKHEMNKIVDSQLGNFGKERFFPGVLLQVEDYNPDEKLLSEMVAFNRSHGIDGEVFFFYEGIKKFKPFFKKLYTPVDGLPNDPKKLSNEKDN